MGAMQINFVNVKEGRLITKLLAQFDITPVKGETLFFVLDTGCHLLS